MFHTIMAKNKFKPEQKGVTSITYGLIQEKLEQMRQRKLATEQRRNNKTEMNDSLSTVNSELNIYHQTQPSIKRVMDDNRLIQFDKQL